MTASTPAGTVVPAGVFCGLFCALDVEGRLLATDAVFFHRRGGSQPQRQRHTARRLRADLDAAHTGDALALVDLFRRVLRDRSGGAVVRAQTAADAAQTGGRLERQTVVVTVGLVSGHGDLGGCVLGELGRELRAERRDPGAVGCIRTPGGDVGVDRVRRDDLRRRRHAKAQRRERVAHLQQRIVHGAVAEHGHERDRGVCPAQSAHARKARLGHAPAVDREEQQQAVVGGEGFRLGVYGDVGAGVRCAELLGEETGDGLCAARGAEEIQVQVVRVHGMASL